MLDIAVLVVIVFFAVRGIKKGFIKSLIDFLGAFIAMAAAGILSLPAAQWVYNTFFHDALTEKVAATVTGLDAADSVQAIFAEFPELILRALEAAGITESGVLAQIDAGTMNIAEAITAAILHKAVKGNIAAAQYIRDTVGEKPTDKTEVELGPNTRSDLEGMSLEEKKAMLDDMLLKLGGSE